MCKPSWKNYRAYRAWVRRRSAELEALHEEHIALDGSEMGGREVTYLEARERIPAEVTALCDGIGGYGAAMFIIMGIGAVVTLLLYYLPMASAGEGCAEGMLGTGMVETALALMAGVAVFASYQAPGFWFMSGTEHGMEEGGRR